MARTVKKNDAVKETAVVTRAEKKDATKNLIRELLAEKPQKHNELLEAVAKLYIERFGSEESENVNDVKGRIGSVLDIMKKESEVAYEGGMYALKARALPEEPKAETPEEPKKKTTRAKKKTTETEKQEEIKTVETLAQAPAEKPVEKPKRATKKKVEEKTEAPKAEELKEEPKTDPAPKKRGRKPKARTEAPKETREETPAVQEEKSAVKAEEKKEEKPVAPALETKTPEAPKSEEESAKNSEETKAEAPVAVEPAPTETEEKALVVKEKGEMTKKSVVMDMSFLFGSVKPARTEKTEEKPEQKTETAKKEEKPAEKPVEKPAQKPVQKAEEKTPQKAEKPIEPKAETRQEKETPKASQNTARTAKTVPVSELSGKKLVRENVRGARKPAERPLTADEKLREAFLKRIRSLGGDYFEYYSVYLLERYSLKNGRRLECMKISGGDHDGGIDGEIELTDKLGFRETIYIQSKNWNPEKGDEKLWVVGETLLQQFIGACACRQAKEGKQNCRGIFITTSRFTPEAKRILDTLSDKIVGYDGNDLYEAAKECSFGLVQKNGEWTLDERLLSGSKAFFNLY